MKFGRRSVTWALAAALLAVPLSAVGPAAPALAAPYGCDGIAYEPFIDQPTRTIVGTGTGWCTSPEHPTGETVTVTVSLWKYSRYWWDEELASASKTGTHVGEFSARYRCTGNGFPEVYTKMTVRSRTVMSRNVVTNFCS